MTKRSYPHQRLIKTVQQEAPERLTDYGELSNAGSQLGPILERANNQYYDIVNKGRRSRLPQTDSGTLSNRSPGRQTDYGELSYEPPKHNPLKDVFSRAVATGVSHAAGTDIGQRLGSRNIQTGARELINLSSPLLDKASNTKIGQKINDYLPYATAAAPVITGALPYIKKYGSQAIKSLPGILKSIRGFLPFEEGGSVPGVGSRQPRQHKYAAGGMLNSPMPLNRRAAPSDNSLTFPSYNFNDLNQLRQSPNFDFNNFMDNENARYQDRLRASLQPRKQYTTQNLREALKNPREVFEEGGAVPRMNPRGAACMSMDKSNIPPEIRRQFVTRGRFGQGQPDFSMPKTGYCTSGSLLKNFTPRNGQRPVEPAVFLNSQQERSPQRFAHGGRVHTNRRNQASHEGNAASPKMQHFMNCFK